MLNKIKEIYRNILAIPKIQGKLDELIWADIYRETIKDVPWLKSLSISPGDMAANFSLLYLLARILKEKKINSILEFGLGQSTRLIESFTINDKTITRHDVIEESAEWAQIFDNKRENKYNTIILSKSTISKHNANIQIFENINIIINNSYDLYLIDGPRGLPNFSRYDICEIASNFHQTEEFIIIIDDFHRAGEKQTTSVLLEILDAKMIKYTKKIFSGTKDQIVIATNKYKIVTMY